MGTRTSRRLSGGMAQTQSGACTQASGDVWRWHFAVMLTSPRKGDGRGKDNLPVFVRSCARVQSHMLPKIRREPDARSDRSPVPHGPILLREEMV